MADTDTIEHRAFIQTRLRNYALTHLTTDYKTFTEDAVAEVLKLLISHRLAHLLLAHLSVPYRSICYRSKLNRYSGRPFQPSFS